MLRMSYWYLADLSALYANLSGWVIRLWDLDNGTRVGLDLLDGGAYVALSHEVQHTPYLLCQ